MGFPITANDLREELKYKPEQGDTADLEFFASAASERIEVEVGKIAGQLIETTAYGPTGSVRLAERAARIGSITAGDVELDVSRFRIVAGAIVRGPFPAGPIIVMTEAPRVSSTLIVLAARRLAKLWFQQSRNGPTAQPGIQDAQPGMQGVGIPRVVAAMLEGKGDLPGIA